MWTSQREKPAGRSSTVSFTPRSSATVSQCFQQGKKRGHSEILLTRPALQGLAEQGKPVSFSHPFPPKGEEHSWEALVKFSVEALAP